MLIIDINKSQVHNELSYDHDVVVIRGASAELINSLVKLVNPASELAEKYVEPSIKVPLAARVDKDIPQNIQAKPGCGGDAKALCTAMSNFRIALAEASAAELAEAGQKVVPTKEENEQDFQEKRDARITFQIKQVDAVLADDKFVEQFRLKLQRHPRLNPASSLVTTRNARVILQLYIYHDLTEGFSSARAAEETDVSTDTISRLANDVELLKTVGRPGKYRYFVKKDVENSLINLLSEPKFSGLMKTLDKLQDQIDSLGSLKS